MPSNPPLSVRDDLVETLHGHQVADPYRWLEDPDSARTRAWVAEQREWAEAHLSTYPERAVFGGLMQQIMTQPRLGTPVRQGQWWFRLVNDGTNDQDVLVGARSLDELLAEPAVLLDPNTWSEQGTTSLASIAASPDGRWLAHGISAAGSDWSRVRVLDLDTGEVSDEQVLAKFSTPQWLPDSSAFTYVAFPDGGRAEGTETQAVGGGHLMLHRLGTPASDDLDLLNFPGDPHRMIHAAVHRALGAADSAGWLVVGLGHGTAWEQAIWVARLTEAEGGQQVGPWHELCPDEDQPRFAIGVDGDWLVLQTTDQAPLGRVVALGLPATPVEGREREVLPEGGSSLEDVVMSADALVVHRLVDASPRVSLHRLDGDLVGPVEVGDGAVVALDADPDSSEVFIATSTVTSPRTSWRLDTSTGDLVELPGPTSTWTAPDVVTTRGRATSADGVEVPYFVITARTASAGPAPTLMYGYGGFGISVLADYRAGWAGWLAAGGTLVITNLRGGSEFGRDWHDQGAGVHKQNVFNDFIAIAEQLIADKVTTSEQLASYGRSNGGLLVGATMTQRPDLFAAAIPQVGVLDLLRFHTFTVGAAWASDYGNPEVADDFEVALAYSPLHAISAGTSYPATLVVTGDHDDRVVPAHSYKFTAALQAVQPDQAGPVLARIETATGHGSGKPVRMQAAEWADVLAFAAHHTGLGPGTR